MNYRSVYLYLIEHGCNFKFFDNLDIWGPKICFLSSWHFFPLFSSLKALIYLSNGHLYFLYPHSICSPFLCTDERFARIFPPSIYTHTHTLFPIPSSLFLDLDSRGFPGGSDGKESACNTGDQSLIPGSERSPGEGNGNPLHYSCLETSMDRGA